MRVRLPQRVTLPSILRLGSLCLLLIAAAEPPAPSAPPTPPNRPEERGEWLVQQIESILTTSRLTNSDVGIAVIDIETGKTVFARNENAKLNPASDVKLVTTGAALGLLGPEYRWKTGVYSEGAVTANELKGKLYFKGYGDPSLGVEDLWEIASELWTRGIRKITGDLVADDSFFDAVRVGPGFDQKQEDFAFRAPCGALSLAHNAVNIHVLPGAAEGAAARVLLDPASNYLLVNSNVVTSATGATQIVVESREQENQTALALHGRIRVRDDGFIAQKRIVHPDLFSAASFREILNRRGIKLSGQVVRGLMPATARPLAVHTSEPLSVLVREVNKRSNNFMAEQILKTIGAELGTPPGSWAKGVQAVKSYLEKIGITGDFVMTNGSGLYDSNRFSAVQLVTLLRALHRDFRISADFVGSLALAGADGTISHRMSGGLAERWVRAKTGTLQGVSCLSGYAGAPAKTPLAFAILMNRVPPAQANAARRAQDQIAELLVAYLSAK